MSHCDPAEIRGVRGARKRDAAISLFTNEIAALPMVARNDSRGLCFQ